MINWTRRSKLEHQIVSCIQEKRIAQLEVNLDFIKQQLDSIGKKFDNGISSDIAVLKSFVEELRERDSIERRFQAELSAIREALQVPEKAVVKKEEELGKKKKLSWANLPLWQKITVIVTITGFLLRNEVRVLINLIVAHYFGVHPN